MKITITLNYEDYNNTNNNCFIHNPNIYSQVYE